MLLCSTPRSRDFTLRGGSHSTDSLVYLWSMYALLTGTTVSVRLSPRIMSCGQLAKADMPPAFLVFCFFTRRELVHRNRAAKKKKMKEEHKRREANPFTGEGGPERRWGWADEVKPGENGLQALPYVSGRSKSTLQALCSGKLHHGGPTETRSPALSPDRRHTYMCTYVRTRK